MTTIDSVSECQIPDSDASRVAAAARSAVRSVSIERQSAELKLQHCDPGRQSQTLSEADESKDLPTFYAKRSAAFCRCRAHGTAQNYNYMLPIFFCHFRDACFCPLHSLYLCGGAHGSGRRGGSIRRSDRSQGRVPPRQERSRGALTRGTRRCSDPCRCRTSPGSASSPCGRHCSRSRPS